MSLTEEQAKKLGELAEEILYERGQQKELEQVLAESSPEEEAELAEIDRLEQELTDRRNRCLAVRQERLKDVFTDLKTCAKAIERKVESLKNYCHNLPKEAVEKGLKFDHKSLNISVSKAEFITTYKAHELLEDHPELEEVYLDGDPLCTMTVVPEVLERLLSSDKLRIDDIDKYRIVTKKRSPSVSLTYTLESE